MANERTTLAKRKRFIKLVFVRQSVIIHQTGALKAVATRERTFSGRFDYSSSFVHKNRSAPNAIAAGRRSPFKDNIMIMELGSITCGCIRSKYRSGINPSRENYLEKTPVRAVTLLVECDCCGWRLRLHPAAARRCDFSAVYLPFSSIYLSAAIGSNRTVSNLRATAARSGEFPIPAGGSSVG